MCGLAGFLDLSRVAGREELESIALAMADAIRHRGPDNRGSWVDEAEGLALGFRRLAIVDLSPEGHQPMISACGRFVLVFNGEIYNYPDLRRALEKGADPPRFRGHSDTEVMLAAIARWGLVEAVRRFVGMFAFALWDRRERRLSLGRDRIGEKPLYYGRMGRMFLFGSELKALRAHPDFRGEICRDALIPFLRHSCIPAPYSIYERVYKLPPATILSVDADGLGGLPEPAPYWSAQEAAAEGADDPFPGNEEEATEELDRMLRDAVGRQMVADVPLGAFLSGGVDSSAVVALMQAQSTRPVRTFTIGFRESAYNEAEYAKEVARHLGTDHTEMYVSPSEAMAVIPELPALYDEPFADSSQIPTFLVSRLARRHVTVSLSGDGGDELFAGYERYSRAAHLRRKLRRVPYAVQRAAAVALMGLSPRGWDRTLRLIRPVLPRRLGRYASGERAHKLSELIDSAWHEEALYRCLSSKWSRATCPVVGVFDHRPLEDTHLGKAPDSFIQSMMLMDLTNFLPDDILVKVDRASMGVGLEARAPFLDHRVVEFAWRLPMSMKIRNGVKKWILRQVLHRYVPSALIDRPKMGFGVPIDSWLRGPLREWSEALLDEGRLRREGFFDPRPIRQKWEEHQSGRRDYHHHLWDVLMFQAWLEAQ
jgi:asparagine synthase (glutamine-hydrolysing)